MANDRLIINRLTAIGIMKIEQVTIADSARIPKRYKN